MKLNLDFDDVLIVPQPSNVNSRADVTLERAFHFKAGGHWYGIPVIAANMQNIGTWNVAKILAKHHMLVALVKGLPLTYSGKNVFNTFGICDCDGVKGGYICLDVANGYTTQFRGFVNVVRREFPTSIIMAGNVATAEGVENLAKAGADIIKVGLGSGAACTTRIKTGVGIPQLSAVLDCVSAAKDFGVYVCSDGGHRTVGDVAKSFAAGADFVMLGSMFAGTEETGRWLYGNASRQVQGQLEKYRAEEGAAIAHPLRGSLDDVVLDILGGLRSACSYVGAANLKELQEKAEFCVRTR